MEIAGAETHVVIPDVDLEHLVLLIDVHDLDEGEGEVDRHAVLVVGHGTSVAALLFVVLHQLLDQLLLFGRRQAPADSCN